MKPQAGHNVEERLGSLFIFVFYLLAISLPLSEAVKQVCMALIMLVGIYLLLTKIIGIKRDIINISGIALVLSSIISSFFAIDTLKALRGNYDIFRIIMIFLIMREAYITIKNMEVFLYLLYLSMLVALIWGAYEYFSNIKELLELHSIGHVNHSAIYLGIIFFLSLSIFLSTYDHISGLKRFALLLVIVSSIFGIFMSGSRAVMFPTIPLTLALLIVTRQYRNKGVLISLILTLFIVIGVVSFNERSLAKLAQGFHESGRPILIKASIMAWLEHNILFGIGPDNSHHINPKVYIETSPFEQITHSHNTFVTYLLERGIIGLTFYLVFIFSIFIRLILDYKRCPHYLVLSAIIIWILNFIVSFGNTTFHDENALLMAILWATALNKGLINPHNQIDGRGKT